MLYIAKHRMPADDVRPIGTAGPREHTRLSGATADSRHPAGYARSTRPNRTGGGGGGPGAEHRIFATCGGLHFWVVTAGKSGALANHQYLSPSRPGR